MQSWLLAKTGAVPSSVVSWRPTLHSRSQLGKRKDSRPPLPSVLALSTQPRDCWLVSTSWCTEPCTQVSSLQHSLAAPLDSKAAETLTAMPVPSSLPTVTPGSSVAPSTGLKEASTSIWPPACPESWCTASVGVCWACMHALRQSQGMLSACHVHACMQASVRTGTSLAAVAWPGQKHRWHVVLSVLGTNLLQICRCPFEGASSAAARHEHLQGLHQPAYQRLHLELGAGGRHHPAADVTLRHGCVLERAS